MNAMPHSNPIPAAAGGSFIPPIYEVPLSHCLDARLMADPRVRRFGANHNAAVYERLLGSRDVVLPIRWVELEHDVFTIVVAPRAAYSDPQVRRTIRQLKLYGSSNFRVVEITETALRREPMLENALEIASCRGSPVFAGDRIRMLTFLVEQGGSAPLEDCSSFMMSGGDPVAAILALVAKKIVWIDLSVPIGPQSAVHQVIRR